MSSTPQEELLAELRLEHKLTLDALLTLVEAMCPGPHKPVLHRDHKPPWCKACRRTALGDLVSSSN